VRMVDLIEKKRDGTRLETDEIEYFVQGYARGVVPDYQASALLMAIVIRGMDDEEVRDLTLAMVRSGDVLDLRDVAPLVVDKHSTGGVGDKVSLVVAPTVAACGLPMGKMSGRGLGFSGGTLDKLEAIPGYRTDLTVEQFKRQLRDIGIVLTGQSANLAPADGKLYALRDVTGTVPSLPLIVASIMSKKIAAGADAIVLDVKVGSGAFMKTLDDARSLAEAMAQIGMVTGRRLTARISDMNQPLGVAVGNSLELCEAIEALKGQGPGDLREHCEVITAELLLIGGIVSSFEEGVSYARRAIASGAALGKFRELVVAQGGDVGYVDDVSRFPQAQIVDRVCSPQGGYVESIRTDEIGNAVVELGGGREQKGDLIDHSVGVLVPVKVGSYVEAGQTVAVVHANDPDRAKRAQQRLLAALGFAQAPVASLPLFYDRVASAD